VRFIFLAFAVVLASCSGGNSQPAAPSFYQPPKGQWADSGTSTGSEIVRAISNPFQIAARPSSNNMLYAQPPAPLAIGKTITLDYSINGNATLGVADPKDIPPATIDFFIWERGDNLSGVGQYEFYRWFARSGTCKRNLVIGDHNIVSCKIDLTWISVFGKPASSNPQAFQQALSNAFAVGFGLGGQYFAAHGVWTASGSATFKINSFTVQ
jgi:hypothetical protein